MTSPTHLQKALALFAQAQALQASRRLPEAARAYAQAGALVPNHTLILAAHASLAMELRDWRAAGEVLRRLSTLQPDNASHHERLARCLGHLGAWESAQHHAEEGWRLSPSPATLYILLHALQQNGCRATLDALVPMALARYPENPAIRAAAATHLLKSGNDYATAFTLLADMRTVADPTSRADDKPQASDWDGAPFTGTLRVIAEAGLGDQLLASSMLPDLAALGQRSQFICEPRLQPLLQRSFPTIECLPANAEGQARVRETLDPRHDRRISAFELGRFFRRRREDFPEQPGWLCADSAASAGIRAADQDRWPGRLHVGLSWQSARRMEDGGSKNIALTDLLPLLQRPDCACISLQYGDVANEIAACLAQHPTATLQVDPALDLTRDIDGLAARIAALDLVITTSNVTAHLAGALGTPCWLLLPKTRPVLWYWGYAGESTPWYPAMRLLRNTVEGNDWHGLIATVMAELDKVCAAHGG